MIHTDAQEVKLWLLGEFRDFNVFSKHLPECSVDALLYKSG